MLNTSSFAGAENVACQIIEMFKGDENTQMVYCSLDGQIRNALDERNIAFAPIKSMCISEVKRVISEQKPDVIHAHDMRASFFAALCGGDVPFVSHIHNNAFNSRRISVKSVLYYFAAKRAKCIYWVSQSAYKNYVFHNSFKQKSKILRNVVSAQSLESKTQADNNTYNYDILFLGRVSGEKNPERFIRVVAKVAKQLPKIKVAVVGMGNYEDKAQNLCRELNLENNISFLGFKSNPYKILLNSKVMLMTSVREGSPLSVLEAMTLGVPVVSTDVAGVSELIKCEQYDFLSNNDDELAKFVTQLLSDDEKRECFSKILKEKSKQFNDIKVYKDNLLKGYNL